MRDRPRRGRRRDRAAQLDAHAHGRAPGWQVATASPVTAVGPARRIDDVADTAVLADTRAERVARRRDVRAVPRRPDVGERELAGVLRRLPQRDARPRRPPPPAPTPGAADARGPTPARPRPAAAAADRAAPPPATPRAGADGRSTPSRCAAPPPASSPTWRRASPSRRPRASARSRPSCSRSTARSSTATWAAPGAARSASPTSSATPSCGPSPTTCPVMNRTFVAGRRRQARRSCATPHVNLGLAVDVEKSDGTRTLLVPVIKDADTLDFRGFWGAYEDLIRKVRTNKLTPDDFAGATVTLTNPGTIGTVQSVPRLMPGQGVIVGVGAIDYPAAYQGADPATLADLGVSKVITITSTYDHRIIQGAESGPVPQEGARAAARRRRASTTRSSAPSACPTRRCSGAATSTRSTARRRCSRSRSRSTRSSTCTACAATSSPTSTRWPGRSRRCSRSSTRPPTGSPSGTSTASSSPAASAGTAAAAARRDPRTCCATRTAARSASSTCTSRSSRRSAGSSSRSRARRRTLALDDQRHILGRLNAAEAFEKFLATKYVGQKRFGLEGAESAIPILDAVLEAAADADLDGAVMGMAHRGRLNVLTNIVGKSYDQVFREFEGNVDPESTQGSGDVKYHLGQVGKFVGPVGQGDRGRAVGQPDPPRGRRPDRASAWPGPSRTRSTSPGRSRCCRC